MEHTLIPSSERRYRLGLWGLPDGIWRRQVSVIGSLLRRIENHYGEKWIGKGESSLPHIQSMISGALRRVVMITGELDPQLYEVTSLPQAIQEAVQRGVNVDIVFHKEGHNLEEAQGRLRLENKTIVKLAKDYPQLVHLYWREKRPESHYAVADSNALFIEEPHKAYRPRKAIAKSHSINLGKRLEDRFDSIILRSECHLIKEP